MSKSRLAVVALVAANLFPVLAVLFWGWSVFEILGLYWAETAVIGVFNIAKMLRIGGAKAIPLCVFFTVHFGGFMMGHGFFLMTLFGDESGPSFGGVLDRRPDIGAILAGVKWQLLAFVLSHGYSYFAYFIAGREYEDKKLERQMFSPYGRIVVMHITIILGAGAAMQFGGSVWVLVLLIALKIGADVFAHRREHRRTAA
ncbi:MAG: DUF6498-containing protein [Planctomycetota bacterium]|nr:DUF6498-containing protein [Planctomycetota bacterium]